MLLKLIFTSLAIIAFSSVGTFAQGPHNDQPASQPFYKRVTQSSGMVADTVPEGKVLVIEHINGRVVRSGTSTEMMGEILLYTSSPDGIEMANEIAPVVTSIFDNHTRFLYTSQVKLYVTSGRQVFLSTNAATSTQVSVSGYYVDVR